MPDRVAPLVEVGIVGHRLLLRLARPETHGSIPRPIRWPATTPWSPAPAAHHVRLGETLDGQPLDLIEAGAEGAPCLWIIGRQHPGETMAGWWMEGFLERLLDPADRTACGLLRRARVHVVPNMNPDGCRRGHLRTNAAGVNLNRAWAAPTMAESPEVFLVRARMERTGVDVCLDVHGDEALPYVFIAGPEGVPSFSAPLARRLELGNDELPARVGFGRQRGNPAGRIIPPGAVQPFPFAAPTGPHADGGRGRSPRCGIAMGHRRGATHVRNRRIARERIGEASVMRSLVPPRSSAVERIEQFHAEFPEIANVPRRHRQSVHSRRGRDHGVLDQRIGLAMLAMPAWISPTVTADRNSRSAGTPSIQFNTPS